MHPKDISIESFDYPLPEERIAKFPLKKRDASQLLVSKNGLITDAKYFNVKQYLPNHSLLVFNNTRVVQARLHFFNRNGRIIEIFCLEPDENEKDITLAMSRTQSVEWICLVGGAKKWKEEFLSQQVICNDKEVTLKVKIVERNGANFRIRFEWNNEGLSFSEVLENVGKTPLPPYMKREAEQADKDRYQTVFAKHDGSVAAPTSGLHFTPALLDELEQSGIKRDFVTLHVGAGTFKPVSSDTLEEHDMHFEFIQVKKDFIKKLIQKVSDPIIPVGTTSMRTLESLYWLGVKCYHFPDVSINDLIVNQWDPYQPELKNISAQEALQALINYMEQHNMKEILTKTQLMIAPGYQFKIANGLITNFHQPKSTLILLVSALIGDHWKDVYQHALDNNYRFLSYGDGCLFLP